MYCFKLAPVSNDKENTVIDQTHNKDIWIIYFITVDEKSSLVGIMVVNLGEEVLITSGKSTYTLEKHLLAHSTYYILLVSHHPLLLLVALLHVVYCPIFICYWIFLFM